MKTFQHGSFSFLPYKDKVDHKMKITLNFCFLLVAFSFVSVVAARSPVLSKLRREIEARRLNVNQVIVNPKSARAYLDNDFEGGSASPWYDESPGYVNWRVENVSSPVERNSTAPRPTAGTQYLRASRNTNLSSGLAVLKSPIFTANPGDRISFDFWIRSKRPEGNNLELVWLVGNTEYLLAGLSQFSTAANYEWRKQSVTIPVDLPADGTLIFYGYCGSNIEDAIAIDNIVVESQSFTTPAPGTNCNILAASFGTIISPNYPSNYPNNANICWLITGAYRINLYYNTFSTEAGKDIFKIYFGETTSSELYAELSGTTRPSSMTLFTESVLIVFTSDSANSDSGFSIDYEVTRATTTVSPEITTTEFLCEIDQLSTTLPPITTTCGGTFGGTLGTIVSPNYPSKYCNNLDCQYLIRFPAGNQIQLYFNVFDTEYRADYVTVYDGASTSSQVVLVGSGSSLASAFTFSSSNEMLVRFTTDSSGSYSGWNATYSLF